MAAHFDVTARIAEGVVAVDNAQTYVLACAARGYRHPDLTLHSVQVRDWYGTEDGLDLRVLDADCAALQSAAHSVADALRLVRAQVPALESAWAGEGGSAASDFLLRHGERAAQLATAAEAAATACAQLRDELWRIVDGKVDATIGIDDRSRQQRSGWLAAARTVLAGGVVAEEATAVVDTEVRPFVDTVIGGDWVPTMRAAVGAVIAAYRAAVDVVASRPAVRFEIPGDLGPRGGPHIAAPVSYVDSPVRPSVAPAAGVAAAEQPTAPQFAAAAPAAGPGPLPVAPPPPEPIMSANPVVPGQNPLSAMTSPPLGAAPGGDPAAGIGALPGRFADALGGLLDAGPAALGEPPTLPESAAEPLSPPELGIDDADPLEAPDGQDETDETDDVEDIGDDAGGADPEGADLEGTSAETDADESGEPDPPAETPDPDCPDGSAPYQAEATTPEEPITEPPPVAAPAVDPSATPCEIAADELPQVGQ